MKVMITGASGHLGAHLVREARADGHDVRALVRPTSDLRGLEGLDVERVQGDLLDPESLARACDGVELVLHAGAVYRNWAPDDDAILRPAVDGTRNVLMAARRAGVRRVVVTSSNATVGYPPPGEVWDESHVMTGATSAYIRAKCDAERVALELAAEGGPEVVVCNPSGILGPWDLRLTPTTRSLKGAASGDPMILDVAITHVADVARGHLLAAERGTPGRRYLLAGENCTAAQLAALVGELCGVRVRAMLPPRFVMRLIAWNEVRKARRGGGDAAITAEQIADVYGRTLFYDSTRARTELGWSARPAREIVLDTLGWLAALGELPGPVAQRVSASRPPDPDWPVPG